MCGLILFYSWKTLSNECVKYFFAERIFSLDVCFYEDICVGFHHGGRNSYVSWSCTHVHCARHMPGQSCQIWGFYCQKSLERKMQMPLARTQGQSRQPCYPGEVGSFGQQERAWDQMCGFSSPTHPFWACYLFISCRAIGLSTRLVLGFEPVASWEPVTLRLGPFQFSLFRKSFILALFSGCWGLGEPRGDLAIGQLSELCWEIWRGAISLCRISSYILLSLPKRVFTVANPTG